VISFLLVITDDFGTSVVLGLAFAGVGGVGCAGGCCCCGGGATFMFTTGAAGETGTETGTGAGAGGAGDLPRVSAETV